MKTKAEKEKLLEELMTLLLEEDMTMTHRLDQDILARGVETLIDDHKRRREWRKQLKIDG